MIYGEIVDHTELYVDCSEEGMFALVRAIVDVASEGRLLRSDITVGDF